MADTNINWFSIMRKVQDAAIPKVRIAMEAELQRLAEEFKNIMHDTIMFDTPEMTARESAVVADTGFDATYLNVISVSFNNKNCKITAKMNFDFTGDKMLESLSPTKQVQDMVVMFNNGYADNNVDPEHPPQGLWHGFWLIITPGFKVGSHFVSRATEKFVNLLTQNGYKVNYQIDGKYK